MRKRILVEFIDDNEWSITNKDILETFNYGEHGVEWQTNNGQYSYFVPYSRIKKVVIESVK